MGKGPSGDGGRAWGWGGCAGAEAQGAGVRPLVTLPCEKWRFPGGGLGLKVGLTCLEAFMRLNLPSFRIPTLLVAGLVCTLDLSAATYRKRPYLLPSATPGRMSLVFQTNGSPGSLVVTYGSTPTALDATASSPVQTHSDYVYRVDLTNLAAGQRVYYRVAMDGAVDTGSFLAPQAVGTSDITFYAYGDTRDDITAQNGVAKALLADVNADPGRRGAFLLHSGDYVYDGTVESEWTSAFFNSTGGPEVKTMLGSLPLVGTIGNHEGTTTLLKKYFPYAFLPSSGFYYSYKQGPVHVLVVDSETVSYSQGSTQYAWLKNELATSTAPLKLVMFHSPAYSAGGGHADNFTAKSQLVPLFTQYGVKVVVGGDNHYYARVPVNGVQYLTSGGGGAPLYTPEASTPNLAKSASAYHFLRFQVLNNATLLRGTAITSGGVVLDTFDVPLSGQPSLQLTCPGNQAVSPGSTVNLTVSPSGGTPPYAIGWLRNGAAIPGATSSTYSFQAQLADHGAVYQATVTDTSVPPQSATCPGAQLSVTDSRDLVLNGTFEGGSTGWAGTTGAIGNWSSYGEPAFEGLKAAYLGGNGRTATETLYQTLTIPSTATQATLGFYLHIDTKETGTTAYDKLAVQVRNSSGSILKTLATYSNANAAPGYQWRTFDCSAFKGQTIRLHFHMTEDSILVTSFLVDQISLRVQ